MTFIETDRLVLRNVQPGDAEIMFDYRNNEICAKYQRGQTKELGRIQDLISRRANDRISGVENAMLAVALKDSGEMVGEIVIMPVETTFSLGYTFSYRHHRKGYAFESLSALIKLLHGICPDYDFICFTESENEPSKSLLRKLGFEYLGYSEGKESDAFGLYCD